MKNLWRSFFSVCHHFFLNLGVTKKADLAFCAFLKATRNPLVLQALIPRPLPWGHLLPSFSCLWRQQLQAHSWGSRLEKSEDLWWFLSGRAWQLTPFFCGALGEWSPSHPPKHWSSCVFTGRVLSTSSDKLLYNQFFRIDGGVTWKQWGGLVSPSVSGTTTWLTLYSLMAGKASELILNAIVI